MESSGDKRSRGRAWRGSSMEGDECGGDKMAVTSMAATEVWFLTGLRQEYVRVIDEPAEVCPEPKQALTELVVSHLLESPFNIRIPC